MGADDPAGLAVSLSFEEVTKGPLLACLKGKDTNSELATEVLPVTLRPVLVQPFNTFPIRQKGGSCMTSDLSN